MNNTKLNKRQNFIKISAKTAMLLATVNFTTLATTLEASSLSKADTIHVNAKV